MTFLHRVGFAVAQVARRTWDFYAGPALTPDALPPYPLRCQHCPEPIEFVGWCGGSMFADPAGRITCDAEQHIPHRPMPSILG